MNLTQGALFRHFPNKEAIWQAVMEWVAERLLARIDRSAQGIESPLAAMEAMFMSHIEFVAEHPGVPRMMFSELQRGESTPAKRMVQTLIQRYGQRLHGLIEKGKASGELSPSLDNEAAVTLFIGTIQGLVMQSLLAGDVERIRHDAPRVFAIYRRGIGSAMLVTGMNSVVPGRFVYHRYRLFRHSSKYQQYLYRHRPLPHR